MTCKTALLSLSLAALSGAVTLPAAAQAEEIGEVSTVFKLLGPNHKIVIEAFDDPQVDGIACHVARAKTGGISGGLGLAEDPSDASLACRQIGPIKVLEQLADGEEVFKKRTSVIFKSLQVVRFYDEKRKVFVYLTYSDKLIEGSPKNSISSVPAAPWGGIEPDLALAHQE